jgi:hypothetical protein
MLPCYSENRKGVDVTVVSRDSTEDPVEKQTREKESKNDGADGRDLKRLTQNPCPHHIPPAGLADGDPFLIQK